MDMIDFNQVVNFVGLQTRLIFEIERRFVLPAELHQVPSKGHLILDNETWYFRKHGLGLRFFRKTSPRIVVDAHDNLPNGLIVDAWRLVQYLESVGEKFESNQIEDFLLESTRYGLLQPTGAKRFQMALPTPKI